MANKIYDLETSGMTITVNGVTMSMAEFKKQNKKSTPAKRKKTVKETSAIFEEVQGIVKHISTLKSLCAYRDHAYRQWGTIANEIFANRGISNSFSKVYIKVGEVNSLLSDIERFAKRNEKSIFQYIEKLSWKLDDVRMAINSLRKYTMESGVCQRYKGHEAINGKGRRLGLQTLINKSYKTLDELDVSIKQLDEIAKDGVDTMSEGNYMGYKERMRMRLA